MFPQACSSMKAFTHSYADLLEKILAFARAREDISCLAQIGSRAGPEALSDEFSDLDLLLVVKNISPYFSGETWLDEIADRWITFNEAAPEINFYERRVIFAGGLDVDFVLVDEAILKEDVGRLPVAKEICRENLLVLNDRAEISPYLDKLRVGKPPFAFPVQTEFSNLVNDFYFHYLWAYKKILRGEYWVALGCIDSYLKTRLLLMLEWHERACHGIEYDTFYAGRHLEKWLEPELAPQVPELFSRYHPVEMESVLRKNVEFFTRIAQETAARLGYSFPDDGRQQLVDWIEETYVHRDQVPDV